MGEDGERPKRCHPLPAPSGPTSPLQGEVKREPEGGEEEAAFPESREIIREMLKISGHFGAFHRVPASVCIAIPVRCGQFPVLHPTGNFLFRNREFLAVIGNCLSRLVS